MVLYVYHNFLILRGEFHDQQYQMLLQVWKYATCSFSIINSFSSVIVNSTESKKSVELSMNQLFNNFANIQ